MATTIQIVVAGVLLLAWIWALGRPMAGSVTQSDYRNIDRRPSPTGRSARAETGVEPGLDTEPGAGVGDLGEAEEMVPLVATMRAWLWRPAAAWRRQLLLATMFASFVSFLLAIALRGSFVLLFLLMASLLIVHLGVAAVVGGRMMAAERAVMVRQAKQYVPRSGGMSIRADRVGDLLHDDATGAAGGVGVDGAEGGELGEEIEPDPFEVAAELAAQLSIEGDEAKRAREVVASEAEVAEPGEVTADAGGAVEAEATAADTGDAAPEADAGGDDPLVDEGEGADTAAAEGDDSELIFRRAAKDEPARPRRKAKPIYIESQLDEEDDAGFRARAVNEQ